MTRNPFNETLDRALWGKLVRVREEGRHIAAGSSASTTAAGASYCMTSRPATARTSRAFSFGTRRLSRS